MLKCDIKNGDHTSVEMAGAFDELLSDTLNLIKAVHKGMNETKPELAEMYREYMIRGLINSNSGVWMLDDKYIKAVFETEHDLNEGILQ
jgi:hypothetical protein